MTKLRNRLLAPDQVLEERPRKMIITVEKTVVDFALDDGGRDRTEKRLY